MLIFAKKQLHQIFLLCFLPMLMVIAGAVYFPFAGINLVREDKLSEQSDLGFIAMGGDGARTQRAFELYQAGRVSQLMFATCAPFVFATIDINIRGSDLAQSYLKKLGLDPTDLIILPETVTSTLDEILALNTFLTNHPEITSVVLISHWYHTSRLGWIAEHYLSHPKVRIQVQSAPVAAATPERWWTSETTFLAVFSEHLKWVYYLVRYYSHST